MVGTAVAGIAGGIAIGAKARPRKRRSLLSPSREQIAEISKGFAAFTRELNKAGEKAEQLGKAID